MRFFKLIAGCLGLSLGFMSSHAHAVTECQGTVTQIWAGDNGHIWITLSSGGAAVISPNDINREAILSLATTALVSKLSVRVRYQADNVSCNSIRYDVAGMYLLG
ncbi:hypothetical protein ATDW_26110 [Asticcacaulis sp. DW145]|uniref:hypothetical protein n=1 Tax=Asticcacaulis sp. DW145 TaxID=3095608 RepID=UPI0030898585|nr:hypothetical protein ATDW_26110 [Asticcacaulis sp. DW145]